MMKRNVVMVVLCLLGSSWLMAQEIDFKKKTHDFGEVKEEEGPITHTFSFVNVGVDTLMVRSVNASCGCTTPAWSQEPIAPGDTGFVKAQYDPFNRPGKFKKSLTIGYQVGEQSATETLYIEGLVQPKPKTIEDELPTVMGALRVQYKSFNLGRITDKEPVTQNFEVYNDSDSSISWRVGKSELPPYIQVSFVPEVLTPNALGVVSLTYDAQAKSDLGFVSDNVVFYTSEREDSIKEFHVIATIEEYFPELTPEELEQAPRLAFDATQHDFGKVNQGTQVETEFKMMNRGKEPLKIRQAKSNCGCTIVALDQKEIAPGEEAKLKITFDSTGRRGRQYKTVTVFTNDPTAPSQMISIKADVND